MRIETYEAHAGADFSLVFNRLGEDGYQDTYEAHAGADFSLVFNRLGEDGYQDTLGRIQWLQCTYST